VENYQVLYQVMALRTMMTLPMCGPHAIFPSLSIPDRAVVTLGDNSARLCRYPVMETCGAASINRHGLRGSAALRRAPIRVRHCGRMSSSKTASEAKEQVLNFWYLLPNGRFRGQLEDGLVVEFDGTLVGPTDPGIVLGPGGVRYVLGNAQQGQVPSTEPVASRSEDTQQGPPQFVLGAVAAVVAGLLLSSVSQWVPGNFIPGMAPAGPVTKTNVTIVETRKTLPDGSTARVVDKTTKRERIVPGQAPKVTERTVRTEKILRDKRSPAAPALPSAAPESIKAAQP